MGHESYKNSYENKCHERSNLDFCHDQNVVIFSVLLVFIVHQQHLCHESIGEAELLEWAYIYIQKSIKNFSELNEEEGLCLNGKVSACHPKMFKFNYLHPLLKGPGSRGYERPFPETLESNCHSYQTIVILMVQGSDSIYSCHEGCELS